MISSSYFAFFRLLYYFIFLSEMYKICHSNFDLLLSALALSQLIGYAIA